MFLSLLCINTHTLLLLCLCTSYAHFFLIFRIRLYIISTYVDV